MIEEKLLISDWYTTIKCSAPECDKGCAGVIYKDDNTLATAMATAYGWCFEHSNEPVEESK